jgi:hypothetical protein
MDGGLSSLKFDADQMSVSNMSASAFSESQYSSSGRSSASGFSETSKKSMRQGAKKKQQKKQLRKKRNVKEGSPYEEEFLIDALKEECKVSQADKDEVKELMKALLFFGLISESTSIHGLLEQVMRA